MASGLTRRILDQFGPLLKRLQQLPSQFSFSNRLLLLLQACPLVLQILIWFLVYRLQHQLRLLGASTSQICIRSRYQLQQHQVHLAMLLQFIRR